MRYLIDPATHHLVHMGTEVSVPGFTVKTALELPADFVFAPGKWLLNGNALVQDPEWVEPPPPPPPEEPE